MEEQASVAWHFKLCRMTALWACEDRPCLNREVHGQFGLRQWQ